MQSKKPQLIEGGLSVDERGEIMFANDFTFEGVKRFYMVSNHKPGFVRAWHAHKKAGKYVLVVQGAALVGAVAIDNWEHPDKNAPIHRFVLSAHKPAVLYIPPGYANGAMTLKTETKIIYFATDTLVQAQQDDYRYPARYWDIWSIEER